MSAVVDWISAAFIVAGALFNLIAGLGVLRLGDVFLRMHASTKAGTLGLGLIVAGLLLQVPDAGVGAKAVAVLLFIITTAPIAAHLVGRAVYRGMTEAEREACRPLEDDTRD